MTEIDLRAILKARARFALRRNCIDAMNDLMTFYKKYKTTFTPLALYGFTDDVIKAEESLAALLETFCDLQSKI